MNKKGGGHAPGRKARVLRTRAEDFRSRSAACRQAISSFSFLTRSFFIAQLVACEEFLAAPFKSALAKQEDATAAQAGAGPQGTNDELPASDPAKPGAEDERPKGPAASSDTHVAQLDPTGVLAEPHEDAPRPSTARGETVATASSGDGGGDDVDSCKHHAHISADVSCVNSLSADSDLGSTQLPGESTLESVRSNVLCDSFSRSIVSSFPPLGMLGDLSNDVVVGIAPVEAAVPPTLATASDTVITVPNDVAGTIASAMVRRRSRKRATPSALYPMTRPARPRRSRQRRSRRSRPWPTPRARCPTTWLARSRRSRRWCRRSRRPPSVLAFSNSQDPEADVLSRWRSQRGFCRRERSFRSAVLQSYTADMGSTCPEGTVSPGSTGSVN